MATEKDFVERISRIAGVSGCLLMKNDGTLLAQTMADTEVYSPLLQISTGLSDEIMSSAGFSYCRYLSFNRINDQAFYIFPIEKYLLGVIQQTDCSVNAMLEQVFHLIGRVSTGRGNPAG
jgi:hypothetical protein